MEFQCPGKRAWPEVVGARGEAAAAKIEMENPDVHAIVLREGTPVTRDFRCNRVRVFVNDHGVVVREPTIG
ncbi:hypothetical protein Vadar_008874 [Vaccinium darrowii]|uniref:Uncharacterized protein n=1 Tax=Vaccinium darrowii TaxID=229202 RepID=A0ACB7X9K3_9ERIC|nr:hypothetical protein Vadar_008874 [Vaccinium darrowii]